MSDKENNGTLSLEFLLNKMLSEMPREDPLKHLENMYDSCNPQLVNWIIDKGKKEVEKLNKKKGQKEANVYFTMGNTNYNRALFSGYFGGLLWLEDYIDSKGKQCNLKDSEIKVFHDVMRKMGLPQFIRNTDKEEKLLYSTATYDACLSSFILWLSRGSLANKEDASITRSNREAVDVITSSALSSYPCLPFTAYYLGSVKTNESILDLTEKISKNVDFTKYVSDKFLELNEPKFVITTNNAPITCLVNHPLVINQYGIRNNNKIDWLTGFVNNEEFNRICIKSGVSSDMVKKYILTTSTETLKKDIELNKPIAKFIESQKIIMDYFDILKKSSGLLGIDEIEKNYI